MAFPQPSADTAVLGNQEFFRLNTSLVSPGDLYESSQSCRGFALGPDSDIANILVTYWDEDGGLGNASGTPQLNQFRLSPDRSFVGRLDAFNTTPQGDIGQLYPLTKRAARIFISSVDLYDPNYRPIGFDAVDDEIDYPAPILDVIQYFSDPPSLIPQRSDRTYKWRFYDTISGAQWIVVPYYGRKYAHLQAQNWNAVEDNDIRVVGVNLTITATASEHIETQLLALTNVPAAGAGAPVDLVIRAADQGMFDLLVIQVGISGTPGSVGPFPINLTVSDDAL